METAQAMMVSCPKSMGGLGYRHIVLNHRVGVPPDYSRYTSAPYYEIDLFAPVRGVGVEYDGDEHSKKARRGHDAERMNVLSLWDTTSRYSRVCSFLGSWICIGR